MRIFLPLALVGLVLLGLGGLYGMKTMLDSKWSDDQTTMFSPYGDTKDFNAGGFAIRSLFEDLTGQTVKKADMDLRGLMPDAPGGWSVRKYEPEDGTIITGHEMQRTAISKSTVNNILQDFNQARGVGKRAEVMTYINGDRMIALLVRAPDQINRNTARGSALGVLSDNIAKSGALAVDEPEPPFIIIDGVPFKMRDQISRVGFNGDIRLDRHRTLEASLDGLITFDVIAHASDADIAALLENIDMPALKALLPQPDTLAALARSPHLMASAQEALDARGDTAPRGVDLVAEIAAGRITSWNDLRTLGYEVTPDVRGLLGKEPTQLYVGRLAFEQAVAEGQNIDASALYDLILGDHEARAEARKAFIESGIAPGLLEAFGTDTPAIADELPRSTELPTQGLPHKAWPHLEAIGRSRTGDKDILTEIVEGKVTSWNDIRTVNYTMTPALADVLGPEPASRAVSRMAFAMTRGSAALDDHDFINDLAFRRVGSRQAAREMDSWSDNLGDVAMALYTKLPEEETAAVAPVLLEPTTQLGRRALAALNRLDGKPSGDRAILTGMVNGTITSWADVETVAYTLTPALGTLLGDEPARLTAPREMFAAAFAENPDIDGEALYRGAAGQPVKPRGALSAISEMIDDRRLENASAEIAAQLGATFGQQAAVPAQPVAPIADASDAPRPTVRRGLSTKGNSAIGGGSCKIENGVRRCVLSTN